MIVEAALRKVFRVYHTGTVAGYHVLNSSRFCSLYPCHSCYLPSPYFVCVRDQPGSLQCRRCIIWDAQGVIVRNGCGKRVHPGGAQRLGKRLGCKPGEKRVDEGGSRKSRQGLSRGLCGSAQTPAAPFVSAATTHASHKRMSDEEKPEAHGPERHDYWAAPSHRQ